MVGFGHYDYRYASGRSGRWFLTGFAPRKQNFTLYIMSGFEGLEQYLQRLGRHKHSKSCLYLRSMDDVDQPVLEEIISQSLGILKDRYCQD